MKFKENDILIVDGKYYDWGESNARLLEIRKGNYPYIMKKVSDGDVGQFSLKEILRKAPAKTWRQ